MTGMHRAALAAGMALALGAVALSAPAPRFVCDEPVFRFGERFADEPAVEHRFRLRNAGEVSLLVSVADSTCGCIASDLSSETIRPGESAELTVRINLKGRSGRQRQTVTLSTNDPKQPQATLIVEGAVKPEADVEPMGVLLGRIPPDRETVSDIRVRFPEGRPNRVLAATPDAKFLRTEVTEVAPLRDYRVRIATVPPLAAPAGSRGDLRAFIRVELERPLFPEIIIPFIAWAATPPSAEPAALPLPAASAVPLSRVIIVRSGTAESLRIEAVDTPVPDIRAEIKPIEGAGFRVRLDGIRPETLPPEAAIVIRGWTEHGPVELRVPFQRPAP